MVYFNQAGATVKREQALLQISDSRAVSDQSLTLHILKHIIVCFNNTSALRITETPGADFHTTLLAQGIVQKLVRLNLTLDLPNMITSIQSLSRVLQLFSFSTLPS